MTTAIVWMLMYYGIHGISTSRTFETFPTEQQCIQLKKDVSKNVKTHHFYCTKVEVVVKK